MSVTHAFLRFEFPRISCGLSVGRGRSPDRDGEVQARIQEEDAQKKTDAHQRKWRDLQRLVK